MYFGYFILKIRLNVLEIAHFDPNFYLARAKWLVRKLEHRSVRRIQKGTSTR